MQNTVQNTEVPVMLGNIQALFLCVKASVLPLEINDFGPLLLPS
jgi:hypothetical protein